MPSRVVVRAVAATVDRNPALDRSHTRGSTVAPGTRATSLPITPIERQVRHQLLVHNLFTRLSTSGPSVTVTCSCLLSTVVEVRRGIQPDAHGHILCHRVWLGACAITTYRPAGNSAST
jgi:hypothetical protein